MATTVRLLQNYTLSGVPYKAGDLVSINDTLATQLSAAKITDSTAAAITQATNEGKVVKYPDVDALSWQKSASKKNDIDNFLSLADIPAGASGVCQVADGSLYSYVNGVGRLQTRGSKGGAFTPLNISGLQCWLDASEPVLTAANAVATNGQVIAKWPDKSGTGNHATSTGSPVVGTWKGKNVVTFNGATAAAKFSIPGLLTAAMNASGMTVILACNRRTSTGTDNRVPISAGAKWNIQNNYAAGTVAMQATGITMFDNSNVKEFAEGMIVAGFSTTESLLFVGNLLTKTAMASDSILSRGAASGSATFAGDALQIGGYDAGFYWEGDISDILVFNRLLTNTEIANIRGFLEAKLYGARKRVICVGDSITSGTNSTGGNNQSIISGATNYPNALKALMGGESNAVVRLDAYPGRTLLQILAVAVGSSVWENFYLPQYDGEQWLVAFAGTNDMGGGDCVASGMLQALCINAMSIGYRVLVVTTLPRTDGVNGAKFEAVRSISNANLRNSWFKFADRILDLDALGSFNSSDHTINPNFSVDNVHLNDVGYQVLAKSVYAAISS